MLERFIHQLNPLRLALLLAILFTALASIVLQSPPMIFMAALLASTLPVSLISGLVASRGLIVTRILPEVGTVGDIISGEVSVENCSAWPSFLIHARSGEAMGQSAPVTADAQRPVLALGGDEHIAPFLRSRARISWQQHWRLQRRGIYALAPARVGAADPLGLSDRLKSSSAAQQIVILPRPVKLDRLFFTGHATTGQQAPRYASSVANAMDFHSVRPWQPGEAIRRVHWKSTARTGRLHIVEWEEDTAADVTVLLDTQASTIAGEGNDSTLEMAIILTASIAAYLLENGYQFQLLHWYQSPPSALNAPLDPLATPGQSHNAPAELRRHDARNAKNIGATLRALTEIQPVSETTATLSQLARHALSHIPAGRSTLIIASTLADIDTAVQTLGGGQPGGAACQAIALDAASFATPSTAAPDLAQLTPAAMQVQETGQKMERIRLARRGDAITAVLDQLL